MHIGSLEDDAIQAQLVQQTLTRAGHTCTMFSRGEDLLAALAKKQVFNLLLLDWEVPGLTGLETLRRVRVHASKPLPVIFLTNRDREEDLVQALQAGADDYVIKPWKAQVLLARINAVDRRYHRSAPSESAFSIGAYHIQPTLGVITLNGQEITLAPKEFELALLLFRNPGRLFTHEALSMSVWNREFLPTSRTLGTHLSNVRKKLQLRPEHGVRLTTSYALGYRLECVAEPALEP